MKWIVFALMFVALYGLLIRDEQMCQARFDQVAAQLELQLEDALKVTTKWLISGGIAL